MTAAKSACQERRHPLAKMYYRLRTRRDSRRQKAMAVWIGVIVGCTPLFGLHLPMCIALARVAGLNFVTTYLASYVNNPLVAPFTLYLGLGIGRWLFTGDWPALNLQEARAVSVWHTGRDVLVGSLVVGVGLGAILAGIVYRFSRPTRARTFAQRLTEDTARRYLDTGVSNWEFVHAKLKFDPLYLGLLKAGILPREGRLLDLGCGRGILLAMLDSARKLYANGRWQTDWPTPPSGLALVGIDRHTATAAVARRALHADVELRVGDLESIELPPCEVITLLDVLFYLAPHVQQALIARVTVALQSGGLLLIREPDARAGFRFTIIRLAERVRALCRGHWRQSFYFRDIAAWTSLLESHGFTVQTRPMSARTPFANVLIEARKP